MDDPLEDLFLESPEGHPPRMNRRWHDFYTSDPCLGFPCGTNELISEFNNDFFWLLAPLFVFLSLSYDLSLIIDIYP
jgi:hypothetical protein